MPAAFAALIEVLLAFGRWLIPKLIQYAGPWIASALLSLGLSWGTYKVVTQPVLNYIRDAMGSMGSLAAQIVAFLAVDKAITIVLSAYVVASATKVVLKKKAT